VRRASAIVLLSIACDGDAGEATDGLPETCNGAPVTTWDNFGAGFVTENCQACHASTAADRQGAPEGVVFDTEEDVWRAAPAILTMATGEEPLMPPRGGVPEDDRYRLEVWLTCGG
jgi:uncharacterized membrane protein